MLSKIIILSLVLLASSCSCGSGETYISRQEMMKKILKADPESRLMIPEDLHQVLVDCTKYRPVCANGYKVKIKNLEVLGLYYHNESDARESARSIKGYHLHNWAFDQVSDEPILERFFESNFEAKKLE